MLPIIFRRKRRYSGYRQVSYRPYGRKRQRHGCIYFFVFLLVALTAIWGLWYFYPLSEEERQAGKTQIIAETRYVIYADSKAIAAFTEAKGDSILENIHKADSIEKKFLQTDTVKALWVRQWELIPYNGHNLVTEAFDTASICNLGQKEIKILLEKQAAFIAQEQEYAKVQEEDVEYFLRTHTVLDNGFDIVARYSKRLEQEKKSLRNASEVIKKALSGHHLSIKLERRYFLASDSTNTRIECIPIQNKDGLIHLSLASSYDTPRYASRLEKKNKALAILKAGNLRKETRLYSAIDSVGHYTGERDSLALPHGYGSLQMYNGSYYEGEWIHGKRTGVGFSIIPGQHLHLGEWKNDVFLGERITYTPERIYGIDISKHQHEKGKKRYSINWKDLRITSLGQMSKKIIHGKVDYPVQFVFIKATEGVTVKNKYFLADYNAARKYGYRTGAYHFYSVKTTGKQQALNFLRNSRYNKGDLPPVLDLEPTDAQIRKIGGINVLFRHVREWLNMVEKQRGVRPIIYISQRFVNKYLSLAPDLHNNYDIWIARYGEYKPNINLLFWQLSPDGRVNGIHGDVDINVYNGFEF